jgi:hypothetical protein
VHGFDLLQVDEEIGDMWGLSSLKIDFCDVGSAFRVVRGERVLFREHR